MSAEAMALAALGALLAVKLSAQTQICCAGGECRNVETFEEADRHLRSVDAARVQRDREIKLALPIDYRDCIVVALQDEMTSDPSQHYFVDGLDIELRRKLRQRGIRALPGTAFPSAWRAFQTRTRSTPYWHFSFAFTGVIQPGEAYQASVGFHCGTLCASRTTYVLKVVGDACEIVSKHWEGGA